jgi:acetyl-CoA acetyltransferase
MGMGACISGAGRSAVGRNLGREPLELGIDGALAAIADAGLQPSDIDGLALFVPDQGSVGVAELQDALGLELEWYIACASGGSSQLSAVWAAMHAVAAGQAKHVLALHASTEGRVRARLGSGGSLPGTARAMPERIGDERAWWLPFGAPSAANIISMYAQRHFREFGTTREQMAQIALVERENAARNPDAIYRAPMTMDDYLAARMICEPFCLYDCDVPTDFCAAVVVSSPDAAYGLRRPPVAVEVLSTTRRSRPSWEGFDDLSTMPLRDAGQALWRKTSLTPSDVDVAQLYDGFSFIAMAWMEALGFCGRGESGPFIEGGDRIRLDGELPVNTQGGQLSAGRMHGWGALPEACAQLWGEAGDRQVPGHPEVAVVATGGGVLGAAVLLTRS